MKVIPHIIFFLLLISSCIAQIDSHYWTNQYGAKGLLLNGAVIASTEDETAIFYNPGAMGRGEKFGLSLSFLSPTYSELSTENFLGEGTIITDRDFGFSPGFAAVGFPLFGNKRFRGGATTFTRFKTNLRFRGREVNEVTNNVDQLLIGNLDFQRKVSERWLGFGLSYKITESLSVGGTQFVVLHSESTDLQIQKDIIQKIRPDLLLSSFRSRLRYSFNASGGFLTKLGLSWKAIEEDVLIGFTITTPTYGFLYKSASFEINELIKSHPDSTFSQSSLSDAHLNKYKTPLSIGYGLEFNYQGWRLSLSAEYFTKINNYSIIESLNDPYNGLTTVPPKEITVRTGNKEILNFAFGAQKQLLDGSTLILGFRTDFNQRKPLEGFSQFEFLASTPSVYHVSAGGLFKLWNNEVSVGLDFGFGSRSGKENLIDFDTVTTENLFDSTSSKIVSTHFRSFVLILTYDFIFKRRK